MWLGISGAQRVNILQGRFGESECIAAWLRQFLIEGTETVRMVAA